MKKCMTPQCGREIRSKAVNAVYCAFCLSFRAHVSEKHSQLLAYIRDLKAIVSRLEEDYEDYV